MRYFPFVGLLIGVALIINSLTYFNNSKLISDFQTVISTTESTYGGVFAGEIGLTHLCFYGTLGVIASCVLAFVLDVAKLQKVYPIFYVIYLISCVLVIVGALSFTSFNDKILIDDFLAPNPDDFEEKNLVLFHFGLAAFDECCAAEGWAAQTPVLSCDDPNLLEPRDQLLDPRIDQYADVVDITLLNACINRQSYYDQALSSIKSTGMCNTLKGSVMPYDAGLEVPTTPLTVGLIIENQYGAIDVPPVTLASHHDIDEQGNPSFGCGIGYYKGFLWFFKVYLDRVVAPAAIYYMVIAGAGILLLVITLIINYLSSQEEKADNKMSNLSPINAPDLKAGGNIQPASDMLDLEKVKTDLRNFYAKYDQSKNESHVDNVANWTMKNGLDALNKKLNEKYNNDLNMV